MTKPKEIEEYWFNPFKKKKNELLPVRSNGLLGCNVCGGALTEIRGCYPGEPKRKVCATCLQERLERIHDETSPDYGKACQNAT